jgi:hypothetical protein
VATELNVSLQISSYMYLADSMRPTVVVSVSVDCNVSGGRTPKGWPSVPSMREECGRRESNVALVTSSKGWLHSGQANEGTAGLQAYSAESSHSLQPLHR